MAAVSRDFGFRLRRGAAYGLALAIVTAVPARAQGTAVAPGGTDMTIDIFLDRLMQAESGGRMNATNPNSTAVGPYQFIASTWLQIARTSFAQETSELKVHEILALRTDPVFARRAAKIYTEGNAAHLVARGTTATFAHLRLAFLVGPGGAVRVLTAKPDAPVATLLGTTVIGANPFMAKMTAEDLMSRTARDIGAGSNATAALTLEPGGIAVAKPAGKTARPKIDVQCSLSLARCRHWLALAERRCRSKRASSE